MIDRHEDPVASTCDDSDRASFESDESAVALPEVNGYDVLRCLDLGGQGSVFLAYQRNTGRRVAIKLLRDVGGNRDLRRERLRREATFLSQLHHPNIVTIHDIGESKGQLFLVTDFIDGVPIDDFVNLQGASVREIVELVVKVCDAMAVAHTAGVIHRDIKPQNIVVDQNSQPYVVDFGLAQSVDDSLPRISEADAVVGTVEYLPPERIAGHHPDTRSDVYALGMVLYECIADRLPFNGNNRAAMLHAIVYDEPIPLRKASGGDKLNPNTAPGHISRDLEAVVLKALRREIKDRYQSTTELADDLRRFLADEPVLARTSSTGYMVQRLLRRYKIQVSVAALLLIMLVVSLGMTISAWRTTERRASEWQALYNMQAAQSISDFERGKRQDETAINSLKAALDVAAAIKHPSPMVQLQQYNTHYRLADILLSQGKLPDARNQVDKAVELAPKVLESGMGHSQTASSLFLRGKIATEEGRYDDAVSSYNASIADFEQLARNPPDDYPYEFQIANVSVRAAQALEKANRPEEAYNYYERARKLRTALAEESPKNANYVMRLADVELLLAEWHVRRGGTDNLKRAVTLCEQGLSRLTVLGKENLSRSGQATQNKLKKTREEAQNAMAKRKSAG